MILKSSARSEIFRSLPLAEACEFGDDSAENMEAIGGEK